MALGCNDDLRRGIWPRSVTVWLVAFWTALLLIRPWEKLLPWMLILHVERTYAIFALIVVCLSGQFRLMPSMQASGVFLWFLGLAVSSVFAFEPSTSWDSLYTYITVFVFFFVLVSVIKTPYQLMFMITCYVLATAVYLAKSQWEYHLYGGYSFSMGVKRLQGVNFTYGHPNAVAGLAVISLPFLVFLWKARGEFTRTWPFPWRKRFTWGLGLSFVVAVSSIILTNSRTGIMAFGGFVLLMAMGKRNFSRVLASLVSGLVLIGVIWMLMPESSRHRLETLWAPIEGDLNDESAVASAEGRAVGFQLGMEMFRRFPATGVGIGNFVPYRKSYLDGGRLVAHNTYAAVLAETGVVGGAAFVFLIIGIFINARRTNRLAKLVSDPMVDLLARLTIACRQSILLFLFVGMAGDFQGFAPLYWIAAYCLLAWSFARTAVQRLETHAFEETTIEEELWDRSSPVLGRV